MRGWVLFVCLIFCSTGLAQSEFTLQEIEDRFPSDGFAHEIEFWRAVFTQHGDRDVAIHDQVDLRLVYRVVTMDKGVRDDPAEFKRQRKHFRSMVKAVGKRLGQIAKWGTESPRLTESHRNLIKVVRTAGVEPSRKKFRELSKQVRYQRGIKEKFQEGLVRSGRYLERIETIFEGYGLPVELAMMPHVESSFSYDAYSKAAAVGMWQFVKGTGRRFLTINRYIDERRDPIAASDAAARYLKENYRTLKSWPLAITAFNHGANGMLRAKKRHGSDFRTIADRYKSRTFGFASRNFYPEFLAAVEVARNSRKYFGDLVFEPPETFDLVSLEKSYRISYFAKIEGVSKEMLKAKNPQLTRHVWTRSRVIPAGVQLRVPPGLGERVRAEVARFKPVPSPVIVAEDGSMKYRVNVGDTLGRIAGNFGTSVRAIQRLNGISNVNRIRIGQLLVVTGPPKNASGRYRVRRGDSLSTIARKFGTSVAHLKTVNGIRNDDLIFPGQVLVLYGATARP